MTGNQLVKYIRNVKYEFSKEVLADYYVAAPSCGILFVSVTFHHKSPKVTTDTLALCRSTLCNASIHLLLFFSI